MLTLRGAGRPSKFVSESAKKRANAAKSRATRLHTVNIRSHIIEWRLIGEENCLKDDSQVAEFLIECYREDVRKRKKRRVTSTPAVGEIADLSSAGVSSVASDKESSMMSGLEKISGPSQSETEERRQPGMQPQTKHRLQPDIHSATISFEDAGEMRDKDDDTYVPDQWDVSMSLYSVYKCRCQLAAVDYMMHVDRAYKKNKKGEPYYNRAYSKAANHWSVKRVKVSKEYKYIPYLMSDIVNRFSAGEEKIRAPVEKQTNGPSHIAKTIAPVLPPLTKELVETQKSRLKAWSF